MKESFEFKKENFPGRKTTMPGFSKGGGEPGHRIICIGTAQHSFNLEQHPDEPVLGGFQILKEFPFAEVLRPLISESNLPRIEVG